MKKTETKKKPLKIWNGRSLGNKYKNSTVYVAAYSVKQATELVEAALGTCISSNEIVNYYHKGRWGDSMKGIVATEPCVYIQEKNKKPVRVV